MQRYFGLLLFVSTISILSACSNKRSTLDVDVSQVKIKDVTINQYNRALFNIDRKHLKEELKQLQPQYPIFLDTDLEDSLNLEKLSAYINDTSLNKINNDCEKAFSDVHELEEEFTDAFRHYKYYFPDREIPKVYTYVSGFDYDNRIQYYNNNLLIAIDLYLGEDYPRYKNLGLPVYLVEKFDKKYLVRDCMEKMAKSSINFKKVGPDLLDLMINEGKILYFVQAMMPESPETTLLDYTQEQLDWANKNESLVWAFLIENKMLYASNPQNMQKFILEGPVYNLFRKNFCTAAWQMDWLENCKKLHGKKHSGQPAAAI